MTTSSIEARLQRLEDIEAIRTLRSRYHQYINESQFDKDQAYRVLELFTKDAVLEVDSHGIHRWEGTEGIRENIRSSVTNRTLLKQYNHSHLVEVTGDKATGTSYFELRYTEKGAPMMIGGRYRDEYVRINGQWLISRQGVRIDFAVPLDKGWAGKNLNYLGAMK